MIDLPINPKTGRRVLVLRQSDLKLWLTDRRDFYFRVFENLEPKERRVGVADIGTYTHEALKAHYLNSMDPIMAIAKLADEQSALFPLLADKLAAAAEFAQIIVTGYFEWLAETGQDHGMRLMNVEDRLTAFIGVYDSIEVYVTGQPDIVMQDDFDMIWIIDHKTVDSFEQITAVLDVDFQGQTYDFILRANGINSVGFRHNQLRRVKRTARAVPPFYNRTEVTFNDHQRRTHGWHLEGMAQEIAHAYQRLTSRNLMSFHQVCPPNFTKDSTWRSDFLALSKLTDTDPEAAKDLKAAAYMQRPTLEDDILASILESEQS